MQPISVSTEKASSTADEKSAVGNVVYRVAEVGKQYSGTVVLSGINIDFVAGEIHGIIGKNGAGKSTLVNIMHGSEEPSTGRLEIFGETVSRLTPARAHDMKVVLVPQKTNYALDLTVADSLFLGSYPKHFLGLIHRAEIRRQSRELLGRIGLDIDPDTRMSCVPLEERRLIEVVKALWCFDAKVLVLDETTAALSIGPREKLFELLRRVTREEGRTVLFISHRLEEMMDICDRITVLRDGLLVETINTDILTIEHLAELITGGRDLSRAVNVGSESAPKVTGPQILKLRDVSQAGAFSGVTLAVGKGEIVGITGMVGSGHSSLLRYLGGVNPHGGSGEIVLDGEVIAPISPQVMKKHGIGYLTSKREEEALFHGQSISNNMMGSSFGRFARKTGFLKGSEVASTVAGLERQLEIKMGSQSDPIDSLSGGNKQKVVVARLLNYGLNVYLFDEIAEGVDIGARRVLLDFIDTKVRANAAVVIASNVVSDLMEVCDRIAVMYQGKIVHTYLKSEFDEHEIYSALQGLELSNQQEMPRE